MNKQGKTPTFIWVVIAVVLIFGAVHYFGIPGQGQTLSTTTTSAPPNVQTQCAVNPTYTYAAQDVYSTLAIPGTDEIKVGTLKPATSLANPPAGQPLQYWKSNASTFCDVQSVSAVSCGAQQVQSNCYQNGTVTVQVFSPADNSFLTSGGGATNVTLAANGVANVRVDYQGAAKKAVMPFGGCVAVEVPNTVASVSLNGAGISSNVACPYQWTYSVSSTSNTYKTFAVPAGFDAAALGDLKSINVQFQGSSSATTGKFYVTFQPANYYITNDGQIALGIEKDKNADTTKTMPGGVQAVAAFHN